MVYKNDPSYLWLKGRIYYYNRHIPRDVRHHYDVTRLVICLKTRRHDLAVKAATRLSHQLEDYWTTLRFGLKTFQVLSDQRTEAPSLSDSLETYLRLKGSSKGKVFEQSAKRSVSLAISIIEDKQLTEYSTSDATKLRDHMLLNGLKVATVKRNLSTLRSIVNLNKTELGLDFSNPFSGIFLPDLNDTKVRNLYFCQQDPEEFARHIIYEYDNAGLNYLRWNGGGDLFDEALIAIEYIRINRPDIVLWIVSRKAELAAQLHYHRNHFIHLSLDRSLIGQKSQIRSMFKHDQVFFSYQVHPKETIQMSVVENVDLIFMHDYQPVPIEYERQDEKFCPLNGAESITDACGQCRRCFDGSLAS